jgi:hypothetical protein
VSVVDYGDYTVTTITTPRGQTQQVQWKPGTAGGNQLALLGKAQTALATNTAALAQSTPAFPLNAAAQQALYNQVTALTRQNNALILFLLGQFTDISAT